MKKPVRKLRGLVVAVILFLACPHIVQARPRALFLLSDFRSWAEATYEYNGYSRSSSGGNTYTSRDHAVEETYHFEGSYGLLDRRWMNGRFAIDLGFAQTLSDSASRGSETNLEGFRGEYYLDGRLFEKSIAPAHFLTSYAQERVLIPFGTDYDRSVSNNSVGLELRNDLLPASILYRTNETRTDGLALDRTQTVDEVRFQLNHRLYGFSQSSFSAGRMTDSTVYARTLPELSSDSFEVAFGNQLTLGNVARPHTLDSRYRESRETGDRQSKRSLWDERLRLLPGKALTLMAVHSLNRDETEGQRRDRTRDELSLEHRLFASLVTRGQVDLEKREYNNGYEQLRGGALNLSYTKELPLESRMGLSLGRRVARTDRELTSNELAVVAETLLVADDNNFLEQNFILVDTVRVFSADRLLQYQVDIDYELQVSGARTELVVLDTAAIPTGTTLSIDYSYTVDPNVDFTSTTDSASLNLSGFGGAWGMFINYGRDRQEADDAGYESLYLTHSRFYMMGVDHNFESGNAGLQYENMHSNWQNLQSWSANILHRRDFAAGSLALRLRNRYTITETLPTSSDPSLQARETRRNILTLSADYGRPLPRNGRLNVRSLGRVSRGDGVNEDNLSLTLGYEFWVGRLEFRLQSEVEWSWNDGNTERDDYLYLYARRYF